MLHHVLVPLYTVVQTANYYRRPKEKTKPKAQPLEVPSKTPNKYAFSWKDLHHQNSQPSHDSDDLPMARWEKASSENDVFVPGTDTTGKKAGKRIWRNYDTINNAEDQFSKTKAEDVARVVTRMKD